ncbi:hypothetical protein JSE7799_02841 [Jannaschia seosinensis]|uniref:Uncharacterized protein n=1 Tax=Jannaschia seosinensis TaxID=313367 RepID=A0A0M7BEA1_9RHOB|nr:hypothetical protein JSE7799_02841 [Jannaschia seosinensis]
MTFSSISRIWRAVLLVSFAVNLDVAGHALRAAIDPHGSRWDEICRVEPISPLGRRFSNADRHAVVDAPRRAQPPQNLGRRARAGDALRFRGQAAQDRPLPPPRPVRCSLC